MEIWIALGVLVVFNIRKKLLLLNFGLEIGDYNKKQCKHNDLKKNCRVKKL